MTSRTVRSLGGAAFVAAALLTACSSGAPQQAFQPHTNTGEIVVKTTAPTKPFDPRLLGTNVPAWLGTSHLTDADFIAKTAALGTPLVRMPGGSWSNGYDWLACENQDATGCNFIGAARPTDYLNFLRTTGLAGMWTLSVNGTAQEAAALVAFFNGNVDDQTEIGTDRKGNDWKTVGTWAKLRSDHGNPEPYPILLWEFGNEVYGSKPAAGGAECADFGWEDGWTCDGNTYVLGDTGHDGYLDVRNAMHSVDPDVSVGAVGVGRQADWNDWGNEVIAKAGDKLDYYIVHEYGFSGTPPADDVLDRPGELWPALMADVNGALTAAEAGRTVPVAITEYNLVAFQDGDTERLMTQARNAFFVADSVGQMAANGVTIANHWNLSNGRPANGTDYGLIDADTGVRSPQYYAMALWSGFGSELLQVSAASIDEKTVRTYAGRADDGTITLLVLNRSTQPAERSIRIDGLNGSVTGTVDAMTATSLDATSVAYNGSTDPSLDLRTPAAATVTMQNGSLDYTFPPLSITRIQVRPVG